MHIELGQRLAFDDHLRGAGETAHQRVKRLLDLKDDAGAARRNQRCVAAKLNRIAKSLLGVQQHRLACDVILTQPQRLRKHAPVGRHIGFLPAPLIFSKAAGEIAPQQPHRRFVAMRNDIVRLQRERLRRTVQRLVIPIELFENFAAIAEHFGIEWPQRLQAVVARQRFGKPLEIMQRVAAIVDCVRIIRARGERQVVIRQRLGMPLHLVQNNAALGQQLRVSRPQRQRAAEIDQRFVMALEPRQRNTAVGQRLDKVRP